MFKDEILENNNRRKIYQVLEKNPGIYLRELQRIVNMPLGTVEYHLDYMTRKKLIFSEAENHHKRYYTKPLDLADKRLLSALRQKRLREIVLIALVNKKIQYQSLAEYFKIPHSTLSLYLKCLVEKNILVRERIGYKSLYRVRDEEAVAKVLIAYKSSLSDKLVDKALAAFMEPSFSNKKPSTSDSIQSLYESPP